jgi:tetratricopeptide (TPR) repeat protein
MADLQKLLKEAGEYFEKKDYPACISLLEQFPRENARRRWEEQRLSEEWEIHLADLKKAAMDLFDQEEFSKSFEHFSYLARQLPEDRTVRDYLALCRQLLGETTLEAGSSILMADPRAAEIPSPHPGKPEESGQEALELEIEKLRSEATLLFNEQKYPESLQIFNYLCHLSPQDHTLQESRDMAKKMSAGIRNAGTEGTVPAAGGEVLQSSGDSRDQIDPGAAQMAKEMSQPGSEPEPAINAARGGKKSPARVLIPAGMILFALGLTGILTWWFFSWMKTPSHLEIVSEPESANIWLNGELKGQTPFRMEIEPGGYGLRVEKEGYLTFSQQILVQKRQPSIHSIKMAKIPVQSFNTEELLVTARAFFSQGQPAEALSRCRRILAKEPQNSGALELRDRILARMEEGKTGSSDQTAPILKNMPPPAPATKEEPKPEPQTPVPPPAGINDSKSAGEISAEPDLQGASIYKVIHRHFIGECRGRLAINSRWIAYIPDERSGERFLRRLGDIEKITVGKNIHIQFRNRAFRFELPETGTEEENREKLIRIYREITGYMAAAKP